MITKDIEIVKNIFSLLDEGIVNGYDSFRYKVEVYEGYMESELEVEFNGEQSTSADTNYNSAVLYDFVKQLKSSALSRGENWKSFQISYQIGEEVKTSFKY
ncbi:hypothetical protein MACH09_41220 [Vibrio sp. MACH09]|uniref:hypothetical protein n=1 Tax=Vibrio sp. MACH09 TaxID=3025122 RepID=UPI0027944160|nr:hypothetical protein [Vibrio sp. MACH09]GLO63614.1 hypothetical protein MACH09_41220 [Vibrio sp. MACH09]